MAGDGRPRALRAAAGGARLTRLHILAPGLLTTVQDMGRFGFAHFGISAAGAADALALRAGNLLVGNAENAAALEMTIAGATVAFESAAVVALAGAAFDGDLEPWTAVEVKAGAVIRCGTARSGARGYLCVRGGIAVPLVLGSASTHLGTALGGLEGRALRKGDSLGIGTAAVRHPRLGANHPPPPSEPGVLHTTPGPQAEAFSTGFYGMPYEVLPDSNRMGLRLRGPALPAPSGQMITEGVGVGAVQVPPGGQPIILFVDHQTTGGYPKIANVIAADFPQLGQLRPRDIVQFQEVPLDEALRRLQRQEAWLYRLVRPVP